jgi:hypothetical protein
MLLLIGLQKSITHPWPRIATCNACRFWKGIGESIHVILVCLDPIIFPCCVCKENTRAPSNTPVVVVLGVVDRPRRWYRNWSSPWGAPMIKCHADSLRGGFQIGGCARLPLRECVPAGCPEPYLYDRFTSGSEVGWGWAARVGSLRPLSRIRRFDFLYGSTKRVQTP